MNTTSGGRLAWQSTSAALVKQEPGKSHSTAVRGVCRLWLGNLRGETGARGVSYRLHTIREKGRDACFAWSGPAPGSRRRHVHFWLAVVSGPVARVADTATDHGGPDRCWRRRRHRWAHLGGAPSRVAGTACHHPKC